MVTLGQINLFIWSIMKRQEAYIVAALRTPVGRAIKGQFKQVRPDDLLVHTIKGVMAHCPHLDPSAIDDVLVGCAMPEAEQGMNMARSAVLLADLPASIPAMIMNRFCSSGLQTIATAADKIALGEAHLMLAGGAESMSMVPIGGHNYCVNPRTLTEPKYQGISYNMGTTAEIVAEKWQVTREEQDAFACLSHARALKAQKEQRFAKEIIPIPVNQEMVTQDEGPRASDLESLSQLNPVFKEKGTVTAGNSSQMSDGAGMTLVASAAAVKKYQLTPLARFVGYSVVGVAPEVMGIGPIAAIPKVLEKTGLSLENIDWIELNEAFAAQALAVIKELNLNPEKVNPYGGAIALGHPLGATGTMRTVTALHALHQHALDYAMITMCVGTGMGAAGIFQRV